MIGHTLVRTASPFEVACLTKCPALKVPLDVEHSLIWTALPVLHPANLTPAMYHSLRLSGLSGSTGCAPLSSAGILSKLDPMYGNVPDGLSSKQREEIVERLRTEVSKFIMKRWKEEDW